MTDQRLSGGWIRCTRLGDGRIACPNCSAALHRELGVWKCDGCGQCYQEAPVKLVKPVDEPPGGEAA